MVYADTVCLYRPYWCHDGYFVFVPGVLWPLQSLPEWLQITSKCLPIALPSEATRSVYIRGAFSNVY